SPLLRYGEYFSDVGKVLLALRDIQYEGSVSGGQVTGNFRGNLRIAANQVRTERLVVLKRPQPVSAARFFQTPIQVGKRLMPNRVRYLHRQLVHYLALSIWRKTFISHPPCIFFTLPSDDSNPNAATSVLKFRPNRA